MGLVREEKGPHGDIAVDIEDLTRTFGDFVAVDHVSLTVKRGEIFGFLGPNGAGKSTTIKMLCGLLMPSGGSGSVGGYDIIRQSEEIKRTIGYMSQRFSLYDDLTVEENIDFFSGIYGVPAERKGERKERVLEMAELGRRRTDLTRTLPGGIKQRLALGCAILHEPPIIFLDEPTSGVDPVSRRNFWDLIYGMSRAGTTTFVTTHYMDEAEYCDRLGLIYRGRLIALGAPAELKADHMKRDVIEIETDRTIEAMDALHAHNIESAIFGSSLHATVEDGGKAIPLIRGILGDARIEFRGVGKITPSLEDVFVNLIEEA